MLWFSKVWPVKAVEARRVWRSLVRFGEVWLGGRVSVWHGWHGEAWRGPARRSRLVRVCRGEVWSGKAVTVC